MIDEYTRAMECDEHYMVPYLYINEEERITVGGKCYQCGDTKKDYAKENYAKEIKELNK